jgi:hypothetical protein
MKVRSGWATEYARDKFDIEVDEADLERLCADWQIQPALRTLFTAAMTFSVLSTLAEMLAAFELAKFLAPGPSGVASDEHGKAVQRYQAAHQAHVAVMQGIRAQFLLDEPQQAAPGQSGAS